LNLAGNLVGGVRIYDPPPDEPKPGVWNLCGTGVGESLTEITLEMLNAAHDYPILTRLAITGHADSIRITKKLVWTLAKETIELVGRKRPLTIETGKQLNNFELAALRAQNIRRCLEGRSAYERSKQKPGKLDDVLIAQENPKKGSFYRGAEIRIGFWIKEATTDGSNQR